MVPQEIVTSSFGWDKFIKCAFETPKNTWGDPVWYSQTGWEKDMNDNFLVQLESVLGIDHQKTGKPTRVSSYLDEGEHLGKRMRCMIDIMFNKKRIGTMISCCHPPRPYAFMPPDIARLSAMDPIIKMINEIYSPVFPNDSAYIGLSASNPDSPGPYLPYLEPAEWRQIVRYGELTSAIRFFSRAYGLLHKAHSDLNLYNRISACMHFGRVKGVRLWLDSTRQAIEQRRKRYFPKAEEAIWMFQDAIRTSPYLQKTIPVQNDEAKRLMYTVIVFGQAAVYSYEVQSQASPFSQNLDH